MMIRHSIALEEQQLRTWSSSKRDVRSTSGLSPQELILTLTIDQKRILLISTRNSSIKRIGRNLKEMAIIVLLTRTYKLSIKRIFPQLSLQKGQKRQL